MPNKKYKARNGDSWIKIANDNNISLNDLLAYNGIDPTSKEPLPVIHPDQEIYLSNPFVLSPSYVSAEAPEDYIEYGDLGKKLIDNYALAVDQGAIKLNDVPEIYRTAVYQKMITNSTDAFARATVPVALNVGLFLANPIGYTLGTLAQKGTAYAVDKISGRNEYDSSDILKYTPVAGREYAEEHPVASGAIDVGTGIVGGTILRNSPQWINYLFQNGRGFIQNAIATTGIPRTTVTYPVKVSNKVQGVFQEGTKGLDKTGTVYAGQAGGYRPVIRIKNTFNHDASSAPTFVWKSPSSAIPFTSVATPPVSLYPPVTPVYPPLPPVKPRVIIKPTPEQHIKEVVPFNAWQGNNPSGGEIVPMIPGTGVVSLVGEAPIGTTIDDQALTQESTYLYPGVYFPRSATYVPNSITGTPTRLHSGLGITYSTYSPGKLIIK